MNRDQFIKSIEETYKKGVELIKVKNKDYAGNENPWKNFYFATLVGVSVDRAILVRISDKLARISNILGKGNAVKDETIEDTLVDAINYLAILKAFIEDGRNTKTNT